MKQTAVIAVGARPNFIKLAPLWRELSASSRFDPIVVHTGQHYDYEMSRIFFEGLDLPKADYNLGVGSGPHGEQTGKMLMALEQVMLNESPDMVLVYGDTNSTLAGALAAAKLHIPLAHVEAGLRSYNRAMPEEINRIVTDHVSDILFCPTQTAVKNLKREGFTNIVNHGQLIPDSYDHLPLATDHVPVVLNVGDVMLDAALASVEVAEEKSMILERLDLGEKGYLLATVHRPSNTDNEDNLRSIVAAFLELEEIVVLPLYPRTKKCLEKYGLYERLKSAANVILTQPLGCLEFLKLEKYARKILTDSGGVQKEAYFFGVPCVTLREETEWVKTLEGGWDVLASSDAAKIVDAVREDFRRDGDRMPFFGDGKAAERIVEITANYL